MRLGREPKQDRSRVTRDRLLDATIESLAEVGWAGTTVVAVAARAGVSRGAAQHHFATRDDLVVAAVERVREQLGEDLLKRGAELPADGRAVAVLQLLADMWVGTVGRAATHLWVAASTDPELAALVLPLESEFNRKLFTVSVELLGADPSRPDVKEAVALALEALRGMGLGALLHRDIERRRPELAQLAAWLGTVPGALGPA